MLTPVKTQSERLACDVPFSFFFDVVQKYWEADSAPAPLHRVCTLARKMGAKTVVVECGLDRADVKDEITALHAHFKSDASFSAVVFSFFCEHAGAEPSELADKDFLGQSVLINFSRQSEKISYLFESMLRKPRLPSQATSNSALLNNHLCTIGEFACHVGGRTFSIPAVYYAQQNSVTTVCAHAALRMVLNTSRPANMISSTTINSQLGVVPPCQGLDGNQIEEVLQKAGYTVFTFDCEELQSKIYLQVLHSILASGFPVLLVFTTGEPDSHHVVHVYGYTHNSDEWHPEGIAAYAGPDSANYYASAGWVDHLLIHDDNFGPYYNLSARALEENASVKAVNFYALTPEPILGNPAFLEVVVAAEIQDNFPALAGRSGGAWFKYITEHPHTFVLRTVFVSRTDYLSHLENSIGHDRSRMQKSEIDLITDLPQHFWITEFSLPNLYTGNRSKLGEFIQANEEPDLDDFTRSIRYVRMPGLLQRWTKGKPDTTHSLSLTAHSPLFGFPVPGQEIW